VHPRGPAGAEHRRAVHPRGPAGAERNPHREPFYHAQKQYRKAQRDGDESNIVYFEKHALWLSNLSLQLEIENPL
jgi:uncharacterized membrane protein